MAKRFEVHSHSEFSNIRLLDCINKIPALIDRAIEIGLSGVALTDHECLSGTPQANSYAQDILKEHPDLTFIYQDYLENNGDVRLYVLNKSVITSIKRDNPNDYRNNFSLGGNVSLFKPSKEIVESAIKIANLLNAGFIGVDFLLTKGGFKIIEIEDPVGSRMVYKTTDIDIISLYIDYVRNNI